MAIVFYECGCCGQFHQAGFIDDCRDDRQRYTADQIDVFGELAEVIDLEQQMEKELEL